MRHTIYILLTLCSILLHTACSSPSTGTPTQAGPDIYTPTHATHFTIRAAAPGAQSVIIDITDPWQGATNTTSPLLILRNGENPPPGYQGQTINTEARRIIAMSSTHTALLEALHATDRIVGVSGLQYIASPTIQAAARAGKITDVGPESAVDYERLAALRPDLVLLYSITTASPMEAKLRALHIPYMYIGEYLEQSPLGKAEWIIPLAEIIGQRQKGINTFSPLPQQYDSLRNLVATHTTTRPRVLLNTPYSGTWLLPPAHSYIAQLITDAGATPLCATTTGNTSTPIDIEQAIHLASTAQYWLNPGTARSIADVRTLAPHLTSSPLLTPGHIYNNNRRTTPSGGNDFYESAIIRPHTILQDLITIFHPRLLPDTITPTYYQPLQ